MSTDSLEARAEVIRRFNRFYTRQIGVLHEYLLDSEFSLTEVRILYELAHRPTLTSSDLCRELGLNAGYVSRVISGFEKRGLIAKTRSPSDARAAQLQLTDKGRTTFEPLSDASRREVIAMLERLSEPQQHQLVDAMGQIQGLLGEATQSYILRDPQPGDMGWIVHRQAVLYAQKYGGTPSTRHSSARSLPSSYGSSTRLASAAGWRKKTGRGSAPRSSCAKTQAQRSCACSMWIPAPAVLGSAAVS